MVARCGSRGVEEVNAGGEEGGGVVKVGEDGDEGALEVVSMDVP